jgi:hypothetical protein
MESKGKNAPHPHPPTRTKTREEGKQADVPKRRGKTRRVQKKKR